MPGGCYRLPSPKQPASHVPSSAQTSGTEALQPQYKPHEHQQRLQESWPWWLAGAKAMLLNGSPHRWCWNTRFQNVNGVKERSPVPRHLEWATCTTSKSFSTTLWTCQDQKIGSKCCSLFELFIWFWCIALESSSGFLKMGWERERSDAHPLVWAPEILWRKGHKT